MFRNSGNRRNEDNRPPLLNSSYPQQLQQTGQGYQAMMGRGPGVYQPTQQPMMNGYQPTQQPMVNGYQPTQQPMMNGYQPTQQQMMNGYQPTQQQMINGYQPSQQPMVNGYQPLQQPTGNGYQPTQQQMVNGYKPLQPPMPMGSSSQQQPMGSSSQQQPMGSSSQQQAVVSPEQMFQGIDKTRTGKITAEQLQSALMAGRGSSFGPTACALLIGMFGTQTRGAVNLTEFQQLFHYVNQWLTTFRLYDLDGSGRIEEGELVQALQRMGYGFSPGFVRYLVARSDPRAGKEVSVDQFIVLCVQIQRFTEAFKARDPEMRGVINISFEDFLQVALSCSE